jgi:hypothetical protein
MALFTQARLLLPTYASSDPFGDMFGWIPEFFEALAGFFLLLMIILVVAIIVGIVLTIIASVGLATVIGMVVTKAASEELDETPSSFKQYASESGGSRWRRHLLGLAAAIFGLGIIPFTLYTIITAQRYGFQNDWYMPARLLGLAGGIVFAIAYQRRRIRRLGKEKAAGVWFCLGLVISAVVVGDMVLVAGTSLAYISLQNFGWLVITAITCGVLTCALLILLKLGPVKENLFFNRDGNTIGPFTESDVDSMLANGQLRQTDLFLREGVHDWVLVGQSELNARMPQQQPLPPQDITNKSDIHFICPHCSYSKQLPASIEGQQGRCPSCSTVTTIKASKKNHL